MRVATSVALPHETALHNELPALASSDYYLNVHDELVPTYWDLTPQPIKRTSIKAAALSQHLMRLAGNKQQTLIGHIALARKGRAPIGHAFSFCATPDDVVYVDGRCYDGIRKQGDPVFTNVTQKYAFISQHDLYARGEYIDNVFYLIRYEMRVSYREALSTNTNCPF